MKQSFELLDTESGFKVSLETSNEVLSSDQLFKLPDVANAILATTKNIADMVSDLNTGVLEPRSAKLLDGKQPSEFALNDLSNVDLQGLNIGGNSEVFNVGRYESAITGAIPAANSFLPWLTSVITPLTTLDSAQKIDDKTLLLKAGRTYKIEGGVVQITASTGAASVYFKLYNSTTGELITLPLNTATYNFTSFTGSAVIRNFLPNFYYTPNVDTYLKLQVNSNSLASCTNYSTGVTVTEYMSKDLALKSVTINGKSFDNNNNIDLEGLSTLSNYSTEEVLTESRWIDGKPIYRRVVFLSTDPVADAAWHTIPFAGVDVASLDTFISTNSINSDADTSMPSQKQFYFSKGGLSYVLYSGNNLGYFKTTPIIILYTKISDTAQSPVRLVGSGNGTAGIVNELPALTGSEGKYLRVNPLSGLLEWKKNYFTTKTNSAAVNYNYNTSTNMVIDSLTSGDTEASATGVNGGFVIPESGVYTISADYFHSSASHVNVAEIVIHIFVNNVSQKRILRSQDLGGSNKGFDFSIDLKLNTGDVITFQTYIWASSATVSNNLVVPANGLHFTLASK